MRVWFIDPGFLDDKRLNAGHHEIHMMRTCILKGRRWGIYTELFKESLQTAATFHDRLVEEKRKRKNPTSEHATPFTWQDQAASFWQREYTPTRELIVQDVRDLRQKWENEGYFFGTGRMDLAILERELGMIPGPGFMEGLLLKQQTRKLIGVTHKDWFKQYRAKKPKSRLQDRLLAFKEAHRETQVTGV
jgi:hypothetical protein